MIKDIGVFTTICQADAHWADQYLAEISRIELSFVIYLDRCSTELADRFFSHPLCLGGICQDNPKREYNEKAKQEVFDIVSRRGFKWAMSWDADETFEEDAPAKLREAARKEVGSLSVRWVCLWGDSEHYRTDGQFGPGRQCYLRERLHNLRMGIPWTFRDPRVYEPSALDHEVTNEVLDLKCLHWGYMTRELREEHKRRWDHNYGPALGGKNPYGLWDMMLDEVNHPATVEEL